MKRIALVTLSLGLALSHFASAEDNDKPAQVQKQHRAHQPTNTAKMAGANQAHIKTKPQGNQRYSNAPARTQYRAQGNGTPVNPGLAQSQLRTHYSASQGASAKARLGNVDPANTARPTRSWANGRGNQDWRKRNGDGSQDSMSGVWQNREIHRNRWDRSHHDRSWYRSHYSRFARFGGGCYYWNSGFWYPAYGYDPYFTYSYDAPVYAYNDLDPAQVIANVQEQLQRIGYYDGILDGQFGPRTRRALLDYQRDNGLPVTGEIDEATLYSLGLQ